MDTRNLFIVADNNMEFIELPKEKLPLIRVRCNLLSHPHLWHNPGIDFSRSLTMVNNTQHHPKVVIIKSTDVPLYCPTDETALWSAHPRVYLPLDENKQAHCEYCGAHYQLENA